MIEVGCGGRYDATNAIRKPLITAITNIDYDHTQLLGSTLKKIAYDKAGIIKRGSIFFTSEQRPTLIKIFKEICHQKKVSLVQLLRQKDHIESNAALVAGMAEHLGIKRAFGLLYPLLFILTLTELDVRTILEQGAK